MNEEYVKAISESVAQEKKFADLHEGSVPVDHKAGKAARKNLKKAGKDIKKILKNIEKDIRASGVGPTRFKAMTVAWENLFDKYY